MSASNQFRLYEKELGEYWNTLIVPARDSTVWTITGTKQRNSNSIGFHDTTVTPSIDASASGHWHGHITNGEIR